MTNCNQRGTTVHLYRSGTARAPGCTWSRYKIKLERGVVGSDAIGRTSNRQLTLEGHVKAYKQLANRYYGLVCRLWTGGQLAVRPIVSLPITPFSNLILYLLQVHPGARAVPLPI